MSVEALSFVVLDPPRGKGRPRFGGGRTYTDAATRHAESAVRAAWQAAGAETLPEGAALVCELRAYLSRPAGHFTRRGALSALGRRAGPLPKVKPDLDNLAKLVCDALEGYAYRGDAAIVALRASKHWTAPADLGPRTEVVVWALQEAL